MKAIVYHECGSPDVLELHDVDTPALEAGQAHGKVAITQGDRD